METNLVIKQKKIHRIQYICSVSGASYSKSDENIFFLEVFFSVNLKLIAPFRSRQSKTKKKRSSNENWTHFPFFSLINHLVVTFVRFIQHFSFVLNKISSVFLSFGKNDRQYTSCKKKKRMHLMKKSTCKFVTEWTICCISLVLNRTLTKIFNNNNKINSRNEKQNYHP